MNAKALQKKFPISRGAEAYEECSECGHTYESHIDTKCPPTPPSKSERPAVKVDEATTFTKSLADATGATATADKAAEAEVHFDRRVVNAIEAEIAIKNLRPYGDNPREQLGDVKSLVESIERIGFVGVLLVRQLPDGTFEVVSGNRRLEAAKQAGLEHVPCHIYELTDVQALEMNLAEQINRRDLTPLEEAEGCRRLIELASYTKEQVASKLGQSPSWVTKRLSLCGLAGEAKKALAKGNLPLTVAMGIAALPNQKLQAETTATAITLAEGGYKSEEILEKLRAEVVRPLSGVPFKLTDADLVPEAGACSKCPYNSNNAQMPGLFDNTKAGATCAKVVCLDEKLMAAWKRDAAPHVERGAKLLNLSESARIFRGNAETLDSASKYVVLDAVAPQDKSKRTWSELMSKAKVDEGVVKHPQRYVARDGKGNARVLCLAEACRTIVAERLKLKWAEKVEGEESTTNAANDEYRQKSEMARVRGKVADEVAVTVAKSIANGGLKLPHLKTLFDEDDMENFAAALGMDAKTRKAFEKAATQNQLAAVAWWTNTGFGWMPDEWEPHLVELAKSEGIDLEAKLKAQLDGAKAEALMTKKAG